MVETGKRENYDFLQISHKVHLKFPLTVISLGYIQLCTFMFKLDFISKNQKYSQLLC